MSLGCFDCGKVNPDEALSKIRTAAKTAAIDNGEAQAIYKEDGDYKYISAAYAINNGLPVIEILSAYR